jgi:hypothetical protein
MNPDNQPRIENILLQQIDPNYFPNQFAKERIESICIENA